MSGLKLTSLLIATVPFINFGPVPGGKLTFSHFVALLLLGLVLIRGRLRFKSPVLYFGCLFLFLVFSFVVGSVFAFSRSYVVTQFANYFFMVAIMVVTFHFSRSRSGKPIRLLEKYFDIGFLYIFASLTLYAVGMMQPQLVRGIIGLFNNADTFDVGAITTTIYEGIFPRLTGFSPEPSFWAIYIITVVAVGITTGRRVYSFKILILLIAVLATFSRTGYIVLLGFAVFEIVRRYPLSSLGLILVGLFVLPLVLSPFALDKVDLSTAQRLGSLTEGWRIFSENPVFGLGWGGFVEYSARHGLDYPVIFNYYLQLAADGGVLVLCSFVAFAAIIFWKTPKTHRGVILAILVSWMSVPAYNLPYVWFLFGVLAAARLPKEIERSSTNTGNLVDANGAFSYESDKIIVCLEKK